MGREREEIINVKGLVIGSLERRTRGSDVVAVVNAAVMVGVVVKEEEEAEEEEEKRKWNWNVKKRK